MTSQRPTWDDVELVFAEPWQGRAYALAHGFAECAGEDFRERLRTALADTSSPLYFESVVHALERVLAADRDSRSALRSARLEAGSYPVTDPAHGEIRVLALRVDDGNRPWAGAMLGSELWRRAHYLEAYWAAAPSGPSGLRAFGRDERLLGDLRVERARLHHLLDDVLFVPLPE